MSCDCRKCCRSFGWFLLLIFVAWWVGLFAGLIHCCIAPYAACCDCAKGTINILYKGVRLPYYVSTFMVKGLTKKKAGLAVLAEA